MRNGMQSTQAIHNFILAYPERCCTLHFKLRSPSLLCYRFRAAFGCMRVPEMFTINGGHYADSLQDHLGLVGVVFRQHDIESGW